MVNKKISNAQATTFKNIDFKSKLEARCYEELLKAKLKFKYEAIQLPLMEGFRINKVHFYHPVGKSFKEDINRAGEYEFIRGITYTPDFYFENKKHIIIIEVKGYPNDAYRNKIKLILWYLHRVITKKKIYFFEPHSLGQIMETVKSIQSILNEEVR